MQPPVTALPRRGQRLAYEAGGRAAAPLRRPPSLQQPEGRAEDDPSRWRSRRERRRRVPERAAIYSPPAAAPVAVPAPALAASPPAPAPEPLRQASAPSLPWDEIEGYLAKGERMLKAGDIAAARLFFSRAAEAGEVRGALAMARSFDPENPAHAPGLRPAAEPAGGGALVRQGEGSRAHASAR